jgi:F-type H+-transporting ATPase subunit delta
MADGSVARRYAKALLEIGKDDNNTDVLGADLQKSLDTMVANDNQLMDALSHPAVSLQERTQILNEILPRMELNPILANFLRLLLDKRRFEFLPQINLQYRELADAHAGRARATVITVRPMSPELEARVKASLERATGKTVLLESQIDPSLIGGMVAHVGGKVYDASVRSRLTDIRYQLLSMNPVIPGEA